MCTGGASLELQATFFLELIKEMSGTQFLHENHATLWLPLRMHVSINTCKAFKYIMQHFLKC